MFYKKARIIRIIPESQDKFKLHFIDNLFPIKKPSFRKRIDIIRDKTMMIIICILERLAETPTTRESNDRAVARQTDSFRVIVFDLSKSALISSVYMFNINLKSYILKVKGISFDILFWIVFLKIPSNNL